MSATETPIDLPNTFEAERRVLTLMLIHDEAHDRAKLRCLPGDFSDSLHRRIFELLREADGASATARLPHVHHQLKGNREAVLYLGRLMATWGHTPRAQGDYWIGRLVEESKTRAIHGLADIATGTLPQNEVLGRINDKIGEIQSRGSSGLSNALLENSIHDTLDTICAQQTRSRAASGLSGVDRQTDGGFSPGESIILAAQTGGGKTCFALQYALEVAKRGGSVGIISLEMAADELQRRLIAQWTGIDLRRLSTGDLRKCDRAVMAPAINEIARLQIGIYDQPAQDLETITGQLVTHKDLYGLDFAVIDYLQIVKAASSKAPLREQVTQISRDIKNLARLLECPVLTLAQMSRDAMRNFSEEGPELYHLKESGAIENDADAVCFLYPEDPEAKTKSVEMAFKLAKFRRGMVGRVPLIWDKPTQTFSEPEMDPLDNQFNEGI